MSTTPYMNLTLPTPTVTTGPEWATEINTALNTIDSHNHTSSHGVPLSSASMNVDGDFSFNHYNGINFRSTRYDNNASVLSLPSDINCLYVKTGDLYYNNGSGGVVQLTLGGALNAASIGGIGGDYSTSTASCFYTAASQAFTFWQNTNTSAKMDIGDLTIRKTTASAAGITLVSPTLSASYTITLPSALPGSRKLLSVDASGFVEDVMDVDGATLEVTTNSLQIKNGGVTGAKIASQTITGSNIALATIDNTMLTASAGILKSQLVSLGQQISSSSGTWRWGATGGGAGTWKDVTNLSVTITTTGRPVFIALIPDGAGQAYINGGNNSFFAFTRGGTQIANYGPFVLSGGSVVAYLFSPSYVFIDPVAAGTYTYKFQGTINPNTIDLYVYNYKLVAYEL